MTCARSEAAEGSVLVEALVGISMLVVMTTTLLSFSTSWLAATEASQIRTDGLEMAADRLAGEMLAARPEGHAHDASADVSGHATVAAELSAWGSGAGLADICGVTGPRGLGGPVVTVARVGDDTPVLRLMGTGLEPRRVRQADQLVAVDGGSLRIEGDGVEGHTVVVRSGEERVDRVIDAGGCLRLPALGPGRHVLAADPDAGGSSLIDEWHRGAGSLDLERSVLDRAMLGRWVLSTPAQVIVDIDASGARLPDVVRPGALRWMVRGDEAREARDPGTARALHPGPMTFVVSSCVNPEAYGSSTSVEVAAGEDIEVLVPLAVVTLEGLEGRSEDAINVVRVTGCSDGSGLRPTVRWEGDLSDGMRIALPHGDWEASVQTIAGARITGPVLMRAGVPDEIVRFP